MPGVSGRIPFLEAFDLSDLSIQSPEFVGEPGKERNQHNDHAPSQKSIDRKLRKLLLYGHTHSGPRKRKNRGKKKRKENKQKEKKEPVSKGTYTPSGLFIPNRDTNFDSYGAPKYRKNPPVAKKDHRKIFLSPLMNPMKSDGVSRLPLENAEQTAIYSVNSLFTDDPSSSTNIKKRSAAPFRRYSSTKVSQLNLSDLLQDIVDFLPDPELILLRQGLQVDLCSKLKDLGIYSQNKASTKPLKDVDNYEIVCVYSFKGCTHVCKKGDLENHLRECKYRAHDDVDYLNTTYYNQYDPLEYILSCPYKICGCDFTCKRKNLTAHLNTCSFRLDLEDTVKFNHLDLDVVQNRVIVCPNAIMGCTEDMKRQDLDAHLQTCKFAPNSTSKSLEETERKNNKVRAFLMAEKERSRRLKDGKNKCFDNQKGFAQVLGAIKATKKLMRDANDAKVGKIIKAAEIELLSKRITYLVGDRELAGSNFRFDEKFEAALSTFLANCDKLLISHTKRINSLKKLLETMAKECFESDLLSVSLFGSFGYGLALPRFSDVDFVINFDEKTLLDPTAMPSNCKKFGRYLESKRHEKIADGHFEVIHTAKIPVIKFSRDGLKVDVTFNVGKHMGVKVKHFIPRLIERCGDIKIREAVVFLKLLLACKGLNESFSGGLGSYAVILMLMASIGKSAAQDSERNKSLLNVVVDFLKMFVNFDPSSKAIYSENVRVDSNKKQAKLVYSGRRKSSVFQSDEFVVVDPMNGENNVTKGCFQFKRIQQSFRNTLSRIESAQQCNPLHSPAVWDVLGIDMGSILH